MKELLTLKPYFLKYKKLLFLGLLFVTLSNAFAIYPVDYVRQSFNLLKDKLTLLNTLSPVARKELVSELTAVVIKYGILILIMALLKGFFMFLMRQTIIVMSRYIEEDLKNDLYQHYQRLTPSFYKRNNTGDLMARIGEDVSRVRMFVGPAVMYVANLLTTFIMVIVVMLTINPKLTACVLLPLPILSYLIFKVSSSINSRSERLQGKLSAISTFAQESFSGIRVLKAYSLEKEWGRKFIEESEGYRQESIQLGKIEAWFTPAVASIVGLSTIIIIGVGGYDQIFKGAGPGDIAGFIIYVNMLIWPVTALGWVSSLIQRASASQKRINEFLNVQPEIKSASDKEVSLNGSIEFREVTFVYPDTGIKALDKVSFTIPNGQSLGIIGKTGSGKTTITSLLFRLYDVSEGEICIDGVNVKNLNLDRLRGKSGFVPQEGFLFSESIKENIAFGLANRSKIKELDSRVEQAAKKARVHDNIIDFAAGYNTLVGERGITLSGGQKQRITIARAIIKDPALLVLDDCLSAVDTETESAIIENLLEIMKDRTTIFISHRINTVKNCDRIIVLDNGSIVEHGTHEQLMLAKGVYNEMYQLQLNTASAT